jgi:hypothetical protein
MKKNSLNKKTKMEEQDLQTIIEEIWPSLKRKHLYPELPTPKVGKIVDLDQQNTEQKDGVGLEMKQKQKADRSPSGSRDYSLYILPLGFSYTSDALCRSQEDHGGESPGQTGC